MDVPKKDSLRVEALATGNVKLDAAIREIRDQLGTYAATEPLIAELLMQAASKNPDTRIHCSDVDTLLAGDVLPNETKQLITYVRDQMNRGFALAKELHKAPDDMAACYDLLSDEAFRHTEHGIVVYSTLIRKIAYARDISHNQKGQIVGELIEKMARTCDLSHVSPKSMSIFSDTVARIYDAIPHDARETINMMTQNKTRHARGELNTKRYNKRYEKQQRRRSA